MLTDTGGTTILEHTDHEKDLGVMIDSKLSFEQHIQGKVNTANSVMGLIRRSYTHLDLDNFKLLFKALVRPHLEYAATVWSPYKSKDIETVENVQRRATKLIPSLRHLTYEDRLRKLKMPTLVYRRARGDMIEMYKIKNKLYDSDVTDFIKSGIYNVTRGHKDRLFKQHARLNVRKNYFGLRTVKAWNQLPNAIVQAPSVKSFENRLDKWWENEEFLYNFKAEYLGGWRRSEAEELDIEAELA